MNKPHKWVSEIKAWADGATIQARYLNAPWKDSAAPNWNQLDGYEFRVKPVPREWWLVRKTGEMMQVYPAQKYSQNCFSSDYEAIRVREVLE